MSFKMTKFLSVLLVILFFTVLCLAPSSDPWDGTGWDVTAPDIDQPHGKDYLELQDLRKGVAIRMNKEHVTLAASSAGGEHKNGAAVAYESTSEPTNRPDGSTALADNAYDRGRLWLDDNFNPPILKRWDGSAWEVIGTIAAGSSPKAYMHNTTHEDTERGRESQIRAYGEQSGGEQHTLGYTEFSHDGTSDDQKGRYLVVLNDGDDANTPSIIVLAIGSDKLVEIDALTLTGALTGGSSSDITINTNKFTVAAATGNVSIAGTLGVTGVATLGDSSQMASSAAPTADADISNKKYVDDEIQTYTNFGSWASKSNNVVYQAATDGFVVAYSDETATSLHIYTDSSNPPTTVRAKEYDNAGGVVKGSITCPVRKSDYWKVQGADAIYWLPMGS